MTRKYLFVCTLAVLVLAFSFSLQAQTVNCSGVPAWSGSSVNYSVGQLVTYKGSEYKCLQSHTSESTWDPADAVSLWSLQGTCSSPTPTPTATPKPTATPVACWTPWVSTTAYTGGAHVSYSNENYQAAFWTQNQVPPTNSGPAGSGQPWIPEGACGTSATPTPTPTATPSATVDPNLAYRLQVVALAAAQLTASQNWTLQYQFLVPPMPTSSTWSYTSGTVYQWGDVDFDSYGSNGAYQISQYQFNQIVPQLILGQALDGSNSNFTPSWMPQSTWGIQSQYFWEDSTGKPFAQTGNIVRVNAGDVITTTISYTASNGTIVASIADNNIAGAAGVSSITITRPFPNDPTLFTSWTDFFNKAQTASATSYVMSKPALDVETYAIDNQTFCGLMPFTLDQVLIPGVTQAASSFQINPAPNGYVVRSSWSTTTSNSLSARRIGFGSKPGPCARGALPIALSDAPFLRGCRAILR